MSYLKIIIHQIDRGLSVKNKIKIDTSKLDDQTSRIFPILISNEQFKLFRYKKTHLDYLESSRHFLAFSSLGIEI